MTRAVVTTLALAVVVATAVVLTSTGDVTRVPDVVAPRVEDATPTVPAPRVDAEESRPLHLDAAEPTRLLAAPSETFALDLAVTLGGKAPTPDDALRVEYGLKSARGHFGPPLGVATLDAEGRASLTLPWREFAPGGGRLRAWARASGPGVLTKTTTKRIPNAPDGLVTMKLHVPRGVELVGRVVDEQGRLVAARVEASVATEDRHTPSGATTTLDGRFTLAVNREGVTRVTAIATSRGAEALRSTDLEGYDLGTGSVRLDVDFLTPPEPVEIVVRGPGVLRGRVRDTHGAPAAGLRVTVQAASALELVDDPRGHPRSTARTDADGMFALHGLRDDLYHVETWNAHGELRLTDTPVRADGRWLEFEVERPCLVIRVVDTDGRPVDVETAPFHALHPTPTWPGEPTLVVIHPDSTVDPLAFVYPLRTAPGEFVVDTADATLDIGVIGGTSRWAPQRVRVPPDVGVDVELVVDTSAELGMLELSVLDHGGRPVHDRVCVRLCDPNHGTVLFEHLCTWTDAGDWPLELAAAPGRYRLEVDGKAQGDGHHGTLMAARTTGGHESLVTVEPGVTTPLVAQLSAPARLRVTLVGEPDDDDRGAPDPGVPDETHLVRMRLERDDAWPDFPLFRHASSWGTTLLAGAPLGETSLSEPLTPGAYRLVATTPGGRTRTRDVVFEPGATLSVTLRFN